MKLLIHIKFNSGEAVEFTTTSIANIGARFWYVHEAALHKCDWADIKELIIKPLPATVE